MNTLTHLSLCTGIGGIDLAAEWAGFKTVAQCEIDDYASRVLAKNFKGIPNLNDIRTVDNARLRAIGVDPEAITLLSAGFPCQPYSLAGKGRGDGDERDLWGEVKRCIGEIKPRWFVGENTPGLFTRATQRYFKRILADLAEMGYSVSWGIWGACDVGAPHKRARVFLCARKIPDPTCERCNKDKIQCRQFIQSVSQKKRERIQTCGSEFGGIYSRTTWWDIEPRVGRVASIVPTTMDRLRCLGNAVVPRQIYPLLKEIADYEIQGD